jgi:hypothetical protein
MNTIAHNLELGTGKGGRPLGLDASDRDKHLYVAGATGTGKSKFLEHLVRQDVIANRQSGCGMLLIDPHGSLYDNIVAWMTLKNLHRPLVLIDMRDAEWVVPYNVLRKREAANPSVVVENFVQAMAHVWGQEGTDQTPLFARWAGNTLRALYEQGCTLADAMYLLDNRADVRAAMTRSLSEPIARQDWRMAAALKPQEFDDRIGSTVNRLRRFLTNEVLRCIFGQTTPSLDLAAAIERGAIILVSLAREGGRVSREDGDLFATLLLTDLWTAAQERGKRKGAKPFYVYLDEFQRFLTPTIAENLDQARGFGLHLTLAHQFPKQLSNAGARGKMIWDSVMENASSKVVFRLTDVENLEPLAKWLFMGVMDPDQIKRELWSTKVMGYNEEWRTSYSRSHMTASAHAEHESTSEGMGYGSLESFGVDDRASGSTDSSTESSSRTAGETYSTQEAHTRGSSRSPMLIPQMGKERTSVESRPLEEQVFRAMQTLFGQGRQEYTARLVGMKAPISVRTPTVEDPLVYPSRVREYVNEQMKRVAFALQTPIALKQLRDREARFANELAGMSTHIEPRTARRRVR